MRRRLIVLTAATALIVGSPLPSRATPKEATPPAKGVTKKAVAKGVAKKTTAESAGLALLDFCEEWMRKLQLRERDNLDHIKWETNPDGVEGTYTSYSQEHVCKLLEGTEKDPVAKIMYREERYKKQGHTIAEAQLSTPDAVEIFDVQEIFHYLKGKWDY